MTPSAQFRDFVVAAGGRAVLDIPRLDLTGPGLVLVLGSSGSGKSTLLRALTGMMDHLGPDEVRGECHVRPTGSRVGYLPQDAQDAFLSFEPEQELVLRARAAGRSRMEAHDWARGQLTALGLAARSHASLAELSAGERKRLALGAIQTHEPVLLLLDEPFNQLDRSWRGLVRKAVLSASTSRLVVASTHDARPWLMDADRALVLRSGRIVADTTGPDLQAHGMEFPDLRLAPAAIPSPARQPVQGEALVELEDVQVRVEGRSVLDGVTHRFGRGLHVVLGDNGAGKTTLLRAIMGLRALDGGVVHVLGQAPGRLGPRIRSALASLLFEDATHGLFAPTVQEEVLFQLSRQPITGCDVNARYREVESDFGLDGLAQRHPLTLSGGEKERVLLAGVDAARTRVVLLDEPTQGLDVAHRRALEAFLERVSTDACVIVATHDEELASRAHSVHRLNAGRLQSLNEVSPRIPS